MLGRELGWGAQNFGVGGNSSTQIRTRFEADPSRWGMPVIIWAGRNDYTSPPTVESNIAAMVADLTSTHYLILSTTNGEGEGIGTTAYTEITTLDASLASTYGAHYVDVREWLVQHYDPNQPADVTDFQNDVVPNSLRGDWQHLDDAGYALVAQKILDSASEL